jgi:putative transposase
VLRVLQPIVERKEKAKSIRSPGWRGATLLVKTHEGQALAVEYSNQVWQCDHTRVDVMLVDPYGEVLGRPWLTTVIDTYSRCIMGIHLGFDVPSSQVVALALRHAILPKKYGPEYKLNCEWGTFGKPVHFYTDGGKDFCSHHLQRIGAARDFVPLASSSLRGWGCGAALPNLEESVVFNLARIHRVECSATP